MDDLTGRTARTAAAERLWAPGDHILVAVSGGPDSTALLHVLHRLSERDGLILTAAHVDHGFRGEESAREAEAVRAFCGSLGIRCETVRIDVPAYMAETHLNAQLAAREKRYAFLHEAAARAGAGRIALAHHADDQAETVLMRLLRGTGTSGLAGMALRRREKNVELIRPFLRITKTEILTYCREVGLPYSMDSSNLQRYYFRNRIRLDVLPYLREFNPQIDQSLCRLAEISAAEDDLLGAETERLFGSLTRPVPGGIAMNRADLAELHVALQRRLIKLILSYLASGPGSIVFERIEDMRLAAVSGERSHAHDAGGGIRFALRDGTVSWQRETGTVRPHADGYAYRIDAGVGRLRVPESGGSFVLTVLPPGSTAAAKGRSEAVFELAALRFPLTVRSRRPGDRMAVKGLNGTKKVQDMFVDDKLDPVLRDTVPLLFDDDGRLLWIPGVRRSSHAEPDGAAGPLLHIAYRPDASGSGD